MLSQPAAALYTVWDQHYWEWLGQWLWFTFDWINLWGAYVSSDCYWFKPKFHLPNVYSALWDLLVSLAAHCTVSNRINISTIQCILKGLSDNWNYHLYSIKTGFVTCVLQPYVNKNNHSYFRNVHVLMLSYFCKLTFSIAMIMKCVKAHNNAISCGNILLFSCDCFSKSLFFSASLPSWC